MNRPSTPLDVGREGFAPCPTCRQYSHSLGEDKLAEAFNHFHTMFSHRGDGIPTQFCFDEQTRDFAQILMAAALSNTQPLDVGATREAIAQELLNNTARDCGVQPPNGYQLLGPFDDSCSIWNVAYRAVIAALSHKAVLDGGLREALEKLVEAVTLRALRGRDHVPAMRAEQDAVVAARRALAASQPEQHLEPLREAGWLIERKDQRGLFYAGASGWHRDHAKALRLCRKADAEAFANSRDWLSTYTRIAEHAWG